MPLTVKALPLVSTCHKAWMKGDRCGQCARGCHCGMDICSNLSLVSQHMRGWPGSGYYCNLWAIDSNPLFLLVWKLIIPLHADRHVFTRDDLQCWYEKLWVCRSSCCISLSTRLKLFPGGLERPLRVNHYITVSQRETRLRWILADLVMVILGRPIRLI